MPDAGADFVAEFNRLKVKLPLKLSPYNIGDIIDSDGRHVCICDLTCERPDQDAVAIAGCIVRTVNACTRYNTKTRPTSWRPFRKIWTPDIAT